MASSVGIPEWFAGKTILVTGGTGFMGKVLLEKLLRSCPDVERIYVLAREKKGFSPATRIEQIVKLPLFDGVRKGNPSVFKKLTAVHGDISMKDLGLSAGDRKKLAEEVQIVFNGAASLRLEATIKPAVEFNTLGTKKVLELSCEMKKLLVFVHLSTAFCHCEYEILEEHIYHTPVSPTDVIQSVQWLDESTLEVITPRLLGVHPNCYTFSKRLTETLVDEYSKKIPVVIMRPSIVTPCYKEPLEGWVDSLNGPVGVVIAGGKGIIRSMMVAEDFFAEVIPCDIAINSLIAIAWDEGQKQRKENQPTPVYNISNGNVQTMTWGEVFKRGKQLSYEYPFEAGLWYPNGNITMNPLKHYLIVILLQIIPAYFIDFILFLVGQKTFMVRVQKRIWVGMQVLQYFTTRKWVFKNDNIQHLCTRMSERDKKTFYISDIRVDEEQYMKSILLGARQFCMKEPTSTLPKARMQLKMLYWLDFVTRWCFTGLVLWLICRMFNVPSVLNFMWFSEKIRN